MIFGFLGIHAGGVVGIGAAAVIRPFGIGLLHQYPVLTSSLLAYAVSMLLCVTLSWRSGQNFDFATIESKTGSFDRVKTDA